MQSTDFTIRPQQANATTQVAVLRELSLEELLEVSGGSPRGGWLEPVPGTTASIEFTASPRGGW